jgi:hypothetical protein
LSDSDGILSKFILLLQVYDEFVLPSYDLLVIFKLLLVTVDFVILLHVHLFQEIRETSDFDV